MKTLTKLLNVLLIILVLSGIVFPILYFKTIQKNKAGYEQLTSVNDSLNDSIAQYNRDKKILQASLIVKDAEINWHKEQISELMLENSNIKKKLEERLEELSDMSLEQILNFLREHYETDSMGIKIITSNNTIVVTVEPRLVREWANDITKLESLQIGLKGYKKQTSEYELLMCNYESKISLLDSTNILNEEIIKGEREKNSNFEKLIENRNQKIKSLKVQRNAAGIIVVVVIVLAII